MITTPTQELYRRYRQQEQLIDWYYPLPYQEPAFLDTSPNQLFEGSNQSGKTDTGAMKVIQILLGVHPTIKRVGPQYGRLVATSLTEGALDVTMAKLKTYIPRTALKGNSWEKGYNRDRRKILFKNGSTLQLMASTQDIDVFKGAVLDLFWMDEECPEPIFDENLTRLGSRNGIFIGTMTPHKGMTWSYRRLVKPAKAGNPDYAYYYFSVLDNFMVDRLAHVKKAALKSDREFEVSIKGRRIALEGMVYPYFEESVHVVRDFVPDPRTQLRIGVDLGFTNPTAACIMGILPDNKKYIMAEYYETLKTVDQAGEEIGELVRKKFPDLPIKKITIDPNSGAQTSGQTGKRNIDVFREAFSRGYGKKVTLLPGERGKGVIEHRTSVVNSMLIAPEKEEPELKVFKTCVNTIEEFQSYVYPSRKEDINQFEKPKEYKNHLMNGLEYICESQPRYIVSTKRSKINYYQSGSIPR